MPDYPSSSATARGITMMQRLVPTTTAVGSVNGFNLLATCPVGKAWEVKTIWMQNNDAALSFKVSLQLVPAGWIGLVSDPHLAVLKNVVLAPGQLLVTNASLGLNSGVAFWGAQRDVADTTAIGVTMTIAGLES